MKKLFILLILTSSTYIGRSQDLGEIKSIAYSWLTSYYTFDIPGALVHSADETAEFMKMIQEMINHTPISDSIMTVVKKTKIEIDENSIVAKEHSALVNYTLSMPDQTDFEPIKKVLKLINTDGKWLVQYTILDAMAENQEMEKIEDELDGEVEE